MNIVARGMDSIRARFGAATSTETVCRAVHEAGHAFYALSVGAHVDLVGIDHLGGFAGYCLYDLVVPARTASKVDRETYANRVLRITLAGVEAPDRLLDSAIARDAPPSRFDRVDIDDALNRLGLSGVDRVAALATARTDVRVVLNRYWRELDAVASALLIAKRLRGDALARLCPSAAESGEMIMLGKRLIAAAA